MNINYLEYLRKKQIKKAFKDSGITKCHYCGIEGEAFKDIWRTFRHGRRGLNLEVDKKDPEGCYTESNCVLACYACNNAKSDVFSYEDFKKVGDVIREIWQQKAREKGIKYEVNPGGTGTK